MKMCPRVTAAYIVTCLLVIVSVASAKQLAISTKLPGPVEKTYRAVFPKGEVTRLDVSEENGVTVYDIEFDDGRAEKETDITADGTMLEFTLVIPAKDVPQAAMRTVKKAAVGAKLGRIEKIEMSYDTKDGNVVKLAKPRIKYAVELTKGKRTTEIVSAPDGTVIEAPDWNAPK